MKKTAATNLKRAWNAHQDWWAIFAPELASRSGTADAAKVSQGYILQRYMIASSSRGAFPVKFNGGLFTVGHDLPPNGNRTNRITTPISAPGNSYREREIPPALLAVVGNGDFDLIKPWFDMYVHDLPLATARTRIYYHHAPLSSGNHAVLGPAA